jgi:hypothetical protein
MHVWERIDVRRFYILRRTRLLARRMPCIIDFPVFRKFGSSKTLWVTHEQRGKEMREDIRYSDFPPSCDFDDRWPMTMSGYEERKVLLKKLCDSVRGVRRRTYFELEIHRVSHTL